MVESFSRKVIVLGTLAAIAVGVLGYSCSRKVPELIPLSVIFGEPERSSVRISPDGTRISYLSTVDGVRNVFMTDVDGKNPRRVTQETQTGIRSYIWAMNSRQILYVYDRSGMDNWRLYGVDVATGETRDYTPWDGLRVEIAGYDKRFPDQIIVAMNRENPAALDAYRLDLRTGELVLAAKNPGTVGKWMTDASFFVRGAVATRPDGGNDFLVRSSASAPWRIARSWSFEDSGTSGPVLFAPDGGSVYCYDATGANAARLIRLSLVDSSVTVIAEDPRFDVALTVFDNDTSEPRLVSFDRERTEWIALDGRDREPLARAKAIDSEAEFNYVGNDTSGTRWLVALVRDDAPNAYYVYDQSSGKATFLFDHQASLRKYAFAKQEAITIKARDGLDLPAYITYPLGSRTTRLPLVLRVHNGPWYRDYFGFWNEVQWLANRGYVVLQVNYRGSRGFGKEFMNAGNREWGGAMESDLIDAAKWAIDRGIADPKRIGITGMLPYGGFAVLSALTTEPGLFACGVSVSGTYDLGSFVKAWPEEAVAYRTMLYHRVGDPVADATLLADRSPINHLDKLATPLLLVQGGKDRQTPRAQSELIVAALKEKRIPYEYLYFPNEAQGFAMGADYLQYCRAVDRFLAQHLGGRFEGTGER